ncbi:hypothetical protein [Spirochaeta dissipatitropha]
MKFILSSLILAISFVSCEAIQIPEIPPVFIHDLYICSSPESALSDNSGRIRILLNLENTGDRVISLLNARFSLADDSGTYYVQGTNHRYSIEVGVDLSPGLIASVEIPLDQIFITNPGNGVQISGFVISAIHFSEGSPWLNPYGFHEIPQTGNQSGAQI